MAPPVASILVNCTRRGETRDFGPYVVEPPANTFTAYVRTFLVGKGWTINSVTNV